jgi:hypothetical protein
MVGLPLLDLEIVSALQMTPPVTQHPDIKLGNLCRTACQHDEVRLAGGSPVIEILDAVSAQTHLRKTRNRLTIQAKGMSKLMQVDMDILRVNILHKILLAHALAPVAACAALETICEPQALVYDR